MLLCQDMFYQKVQNIEKFPINTKKNFILKQQEINFELVI